MNKPLNASQLKSAIDAGRQSDKIAGFDPAAAPLGTDEEAAGTPSPAMANDAAAVPRPPGQTVDPADSIAPDADGRQRSPAVRNALLIAVIAGAVLILLLYYAWRPV